MPESEDKSGKINNTHSLDIQAVQSKNSVFQAFTKAKGPLNAASFKLDCSILKWVLKYSV